MCLNRVNDRVSEKKMFCVLQKIKPKFFKIIICFALENVSGLFQPGLFKIFSVIELFIEKKQFRSHEMID